MVRNCCLILVAVSGILPAVEQPWKDKAVTEWSDSDARQILSESPWAKSSAPKIERLLNGGRGSRVGIGRSGVGVGRPRQSSQGTLPNLIVRWESALPVQEAQLKLRNADAPSISEDDYMIAVLGLPSSIVGADPGVLAGQLKHEGELRREGKKPVRSSEARVLPRDDGLVILFLFPRSNEISPGDKTIEFKARVGVFDIDQSYDLSEMIFSGKLQL